MAGKWGHPGGLNPNRLCLHKKRGTSAQTAHTEHHVHVNVEMGWKPYNSDKPEVPQMAGKPRRSQVSVPEATLPTEGTL